MTTEYSGGSDPKRIMELLWGAPERTRRGPKPRLSVDQIVAAATALADAEGLAALSMRRVAERLGVTAMSLYTYVPGKAELLDLMLDRACAETAKPDDVPGGWRARLALVAREAWALYLRHPWLLHVATNRPVLGPNLIARYDYELRAVEGTGLTDIEMDLVVTMVGDYVHGAVRGALAAAALPRDTGKSDDEWWEELSPLLEQVYDAARFPLATRVGAAAGEEYNAPVDPARAFEFGLERLLDGVAALIERR
ncbi:TetR/AcrR family transcriptional regulator [Phytohabitans sp. ZYX-F-186]|uniref:TetR/AcrR family transcriptional regulator n=1 Tax=Phytohabitans maris TaxID=3071409 RepID=A0ABU0ZC69_9ACTN|nr:TetR/AcrR family transcriptional regulator [Phytohabitans sp. ZYX-F-186]MDQ7903917.1 TetR/AcrR family transcriptional regulator [Phytohabitans sp. ZYX-F-186]